MINKRRVEVYLRGLFGRDLVLMNLYPLGAGVHGTGYSVVVKVKGRQRRFVLKEVTGHGLGHDFPSDRAAMFLWAKENYGRLPKHVKPLDVATRRADGSIQSIPSGREYYLLMREARGIHYFHDLEAMADKPGLDKTDIKKIRMMVEYLARIHRVKKDSRTLYWRKLRDIIGHGECLMGVFDTYPDGVISYEEMAEIEKRCLDWRVRLKHKFKRLCQIHGDFHPGNIWFKDNKDFILLDRNRGPWGDAADDITALTINYIFFSINHFGRLHGPYLEALKLFYKDYLKKTGDTEILEVVAPFYAFRGVVVANPVFYPQVSQINRRKILDFVIGILETDRFEPERVNEYIRQGEQNRR